MPSATPIQNPSGWLAILNKLGIPSFGKWYLSDTVLPVTLVDSEVALTTNLVTPLLGTPASAGELAAPAANTRLADTGALTAGSWNIVAVVSNSEAVTVANIGYRLRRRNAADLADVWSHRFVIPGAGALYFAGRFSVALNERFVLENTAAGTATVIHQGSIFITPG